MPAEKNSILIPFRSQAINQKCHFEECTQVLVTVFLGLCAETARNAMVVLAPSGLLPPGYLLLFKIGNLNAF